MKIARIETIPLKIPFSHGGAPFGWGGQAWRTLDYLVIRVEADNGLVGWGDAFAYNGALRAVAAAFQEMVLPVALGRDGGDIAGLMEDLQRKLHLAGRYGLTMFALSGLDIALWDLAAKAAGMPLARYLGAARRSEVEAYASLFRYGDPETVAERTHAAVADGYAYVKLHEIDEQSVKAAREAAGPRTRLMIDTNCPWPPAEAARMARRFKPYDIFWLEEPIFPPENFAALAELQRAVGVPLAAGENASTAFEFDKMFKAGAVTFAQPSVTKVGGVSEFRKIATLAEIANVEIMPHSPYFGPGLLATLQLAATLPGRPLIERFYIDLEASLYGELIDVEDGKFRIPDGPGLGAEPDPAVIATYRVPLG